MPYYAYVTENVPEKAVAAATPLPTLNPRASSWGLVHVAGSPSTTRIPSPGPQGIAGTDLGVWNRQGKGSTNAPDYILPSLYVTNNTPQLVRHESTNELPIPAENPNGVKAPYSTALISTAPVPAIAQRASRLGGRKVTAWPRATLTWPTYSGGRG